MLSNSYRSVEIANETSANIAVNDAGTLSTTSINNYLNPGAKLNLLIKSSSALSVATTSHIYLISYISYINNNGNAVSTVIISKKTDEFFLSIAGVVHLSNVSFELIIPKLLNYKSFISSVFSIINKTDQIMTDVEAQFSTI